MGGTATGERKVVVEPVVGGEPALVVWTVVNGSHPLEGARGACFVVRLICASKGVFVLCAGEEGTKGVCTIVVGRKRQSIVIARAREKEGESGGRWNGCVFSLGICTTPMLSMGG